MMTTNEIRKKFLEFFESKGHKVIASDSLVPKNDPTVLFTTAGMQQFKRQFLGNIDDFTKATTSQKCMRTDDLDEVGKTNFHHTFFEMLGNFSFGDYFKKEAIAWGWEFLTVTMGIPADRLWVSVYKDDNEAYKIWLNDIGIPKNKIFKLGPKSNYWPSNAVENGPNGPCGPCSEIFYDYEPQKGGNPKDPDDEPGRFSEVWNLVFTQFERKDGGLLAPLPNKNIDTGMGLERLASVMQGKACNFDIDIFAPILIAIKSELGIDANNIQIDHEKKFVTREERIIADHIRAIVFGISDGIIPSNKERGSVIRKLIITCSDISIRNGNNKPAVYKLVPSVCTAMGEQYPEIKEKSKEVATMIESVEKAYIKVRKEKLPSLEEKLMDILKRTSSKGEIALDVGKILFEFKDTHGLTLETMRSLVNIVFGNFDSDEIYEAALPAFNNLMSKQQEQSRASSKMTGDVFTGNNLDLGAPKTEFVGHKHANSTSTIMRLVSGNQKVTEVSKGDEVMVILDKSPFYAESGGQIGDTGFIKNPTGSIKVKDTQKIDDIFLHIGTVEEGLFKVNETITAEIDIERRLSIMRNHTATHLLQNALREALGKHVQQQGSYVSQDRLRFDFTHHKALTKQEIINVETLVNNYVIDCETVTKEFLTADQAKNIGALAFFAEKYGEVVRVVSIGNYSKEFCGGTHLDTTGQIGLFKIVSENAIAQGIRRIEAKTGQGALEHTNELLNQLDAIAQTLKSPTDELAERINAQNTKIKFLQKELEKYKIDAFKNSIDSIIESAEKIEKTNLISHFVKEADMATLRKIADLIKNKIESAIIVLGGTTDENASIIVSVSNDLIKKNISANDLIKEIAPLIGGSGGGRPQMAQAGSKETYNVEKAIKKANSIIKRIINL
ncbi:MAG: alanine--tRNA ligase [Omnitrophica WOR_2 bacterium RIFOXYA12_FULL_38_10]|nr:MAG: alanine--tRNA ligase [Omnitrophica WOR_2 bacterium RIFOXYA12_FULL_38_10]